MGADHVRTTIVLNDNDYDKYFNLKDKYEVNNYV